MLFRGEFKFFLILVFALSGCFNEGQLRKTGGNQRLNTNPGLGNFPFAAGPRALKIIFKQTGTANPSGSFNINANPELGTSLVFGEGRKVIRYFKADGSTILADAVTSPDQMPAFIERAEITLGGSQNRGTAGRNISLSMGCSAFTPSTVSGHACLIPPSTTNTPCTGPTGFWAINEQSCMHEGNNRRPLIGVGNSNDPVRFIMKLKLSEMSGFENLRITFQYIASTMRSDGQGSAPINCFPGGNNPRFDIGASNCSDLSWQAYVSENLDPTASKAHPLRVLIPPISSHPENGIISGAPTTSQVIVPISQIRKPGQNSLYFILSRKNAYTGNPTACAVVSPNPPAGYIHYTAPCHGVVMIDALIERY